MAATRGSKLSSLKGLAVDASTNAIFRGFILPVVSDLDNKHAAAAPTIPAPTIITSYESAMTSLWRCHTHSKLYKTMA